jgi:DNA-binding FadR family transcriptional regulator
MPPNSAKRPRVVDGYREPAAGKSMHTRIVRDIGMDIVAGKHPPGERLPGEAVLCASYGVSRPVLREATRVLVAKGLVISRQKAGVTVQPRAQWHLLDPDVLYWLIQTQPPAEFVDTLMTVRRIIEPAAAALAAVQATPAQLQAVAAAYDGMERATTPEALLEPDVAFHRLIAEATNNPLLAYIGNMLSLALGESIKLSSKLPNTHALSLPRHKAILTALLNRDASSARQASFVLLEETREDIHQILVGMPEAHEAGRLR